LDVRGRRCQLSKCRRTATVPYASRRICGVPWRSQKWLCCLAPRAPASHRSQRKCSTSSGSANFSRQGIDRLVLVRVVESRAELERLLAAVPRGRATVCHLAASPSTAEERIRRREAGSSTESLVARGRQLGAMAPDADFVDIVLETDGKTPAELATELLAKLGWID
jgi:hypothetical protein